jgi:hypothetical protein
MTDSINKPHEFTLKPLTLKGKNIEKLENIVFEMFDKLRSEGIIDNDPREPYEPHGKDKFVAPNGVMSFYLYEVQ